MKTIFSNTKSSDFSFSINRKNSIAQSKPFYIFGTSISLIFVLFDNAITHSMIEKKSLNGITSVSSWSKSSKTSGVAMLPGLISVIIC